MASLLAVYLAGVGSDLVAGEVATRRLETLACLPAPLRLVWAAKITFLVFAGVAFSLWLALCVASLHAIGGGPRTSSALVGGLSSAGWLFPPALAVGTLSLFFGTLLPRSFAAALLAILVAGAAIAAFHFTSFQALELRPGRREIAAVSLVLGAAFATGSALAVSRGRLHAGARFRPVLLGVSAVSTFLLPAGAIGAHSLRAWLTLDPGDPEARIEEIYPSPDGRFLAMQVAKEGHRHSKRVWILGIDDGRLHALPGLFLSLGFGLASDRTDSPWTPEGRLAVRTDEPKAKGLFAALDKKVRPRGVRPGSVGEVDPGTGESLLPPTFPQITTDRRILRMGWAILDVREVPCVPRAWSAKVEWPERGIVREFQSAFSPRLSPEPGVVFHFPEPDRLVRLELETGSETTLLVSGAINSWISPSPDGTHLLAGLDRQWTALDATDGKALAGPWPYERWPAWGSGRSDGRYVVLHNPTEIVDLIGGGTVEIQSGAEGSLFHDVGLLPDARVVVLRPGLRIVDLLDSGGCVLRRLYGPRGKGS